MNTTVKVAALVSVLVFGGIIGIFLAMDPGKDVQKEKTNEFAESSITGSSSGRVASVESELGEAITSADIVDRGRVKLTVEVRDTTRNIPLRAAMIRVFCVRCFLSSAYPLTRIIPV